MLTIAPPVVPCWHIKIVKSFHHTLKQGLFMKRRLPYFTKYANFTEW
jgi:hypothetical protein